MFYLGQKLYLINVMVIKEPGLRRKIQKKGDSTRTVIACLSIWSTLLINPVYN